VVADIGCGTGALEVGLLESKVPFQRLYAIDIDSVSLGILRRILLHLPDSERVLPLQVEPGETGLEAASVDVMVVDTVQLHQPPDETDPWASHPTDPQVLAMLTVLKKALKSGGRLHVIENLPADRVPEPSADVVRLPYEEAGFQFIQVERLRDPPTNSGAWYLMFRNP
jgi:predicted RNA methylase